MITFHIVLEESIRRRWPLLYTILSFSFYARTIVPDESRPVPRSEAGQSLRVVRSPARMEEWVDSDFSACRAGAVASIVPPKPGTRIVWKVG